jgi:hypothetical protein
MDNIQNNEQCIFTKSIISKLENVKIKGENETLTNEI